MGNDKQIVTPETPPREFIQVDTTSNTISTRDGGTLDSVTTKED